MEGVWILGDTLETVGGYRGSQRDIIPRPAEVIRHLPTPSESVIQILIAFLLLIQLLALLAAKPGIVIGYNVSLVTILAQPQRTLFIGQHEGKKSSIF